MLAKTHAIETVTQRPVQPNGVLQRSIPRTSCVHPPGDHTEDVAPHHSRWERTVEEIDFLRCSDLGRAWKVAANGDADGDLPHALTSLARRVGWAGSSNAPRYLIGRALCQNTVPAYSPECFRLLRCCFMRIARSKSCRDLELSRYHGQRCDAS